MNDETMRNDAIEYTIDTLENYCGYYCDLHNEVFNTDYYIIGTWEAEKALDEVNVWEAIEKVQDYEKSNFGETITDLSSPENVVNMLFYIIGEELIGELETLRDVWDDESTVKVNELIIDELKQLL